MGTIDSITKWTIIEDQDSSPYMTNIHVGFVLVLRDVSLLLLLLISYFLCRIEFVFIELNSILYRWLRFVPFFLTPNVI